MVYVKRTEFKITNGHVLPQEERYFLLKSHYIFFACRLMFETSEKLRFIGNNLLREIKIFDTYYLK